MLLRLRHRLAVVALAALALAAGCSRDERSGPIQTDAQKLVGLLSVRAIPTSIGPVVVGEVQNRSKAPVQNVRVTVRLENGQGGRIGEEFGYALLSVLPPGAKAPFSIPFSVGRASIGKLETALEAQEGGAGKAVRLQIVDQKPRRHGPLYRVGGTLRNSHGDQVTFPKVVATFYDEEGRVVGAEIDYVDPEVMGPGQTGSFDVILNERVKLVSKFTLVGEGTTQKAEPAAAEQPN